MSSELPTSTAPLRPRLSKSQLFEATTGLTSNPATLSIPNPDGVFERFAIVESPIFEPEFAEKFSNIKTCRGQDFDADGDGIAGGNFVLVIAKPTGSIDASMT